MFTPTSHQPHTDFTSFSYIDIVKEYDFCDVLNYYFSDYFSGKDYHIDIEEKFPDIYKYLEMYKEEYDIGFKEYIFNSKVKLLS